MKYYSIVLKTLEYQMKPYIRIILFLILCILLSKTITELQRYAHTPRFIHILIFGTGESFLYYFSLCFGVIISLLVPTEKQLKLSFFVCVFFAVTILFAAYFFVNNEHPIENCSYYEMKFFLRLFIKEIWFNFKLYYFWEILLFWLIVLSGKILSKYFKI